ncbi:RNA polymerase II transcription elongation factor-domain-containing protein [Desarmillaria tabescens]|uniref:RNA polymerase II transcription elongation factor-domain-containing protein n=1 Tax=Armillaria tabescens TaxID=1929756 RepID=A0AA39U628_ARMTA|nr:RNA polymerase II transcription elongation factor-domain-containing protein [Desarmillaria tabescens]KAK0467715.1 RNA polymerase II transcription elongation factor-domain-containing protein [Desarmillaria tabescens]
MAATTTTSAFALPHGRHDVTIGTSLSRLLRQRKGTAPAKRSNMPDRDFYSLRYNFKPSSVDTTKSGTLEVRKNQGDSATVTVEHPSTQSGEVHRFNGNENAAKDYACVLIFDEQTGRFSLEKLDSVLTVDYAERRAAAPAETRPPAPSRPPSASYTQASSSRPAAKPKPAKDTRRDLSDADFEGLVEDIPLGRQQDQEEGEVTLSPPRPPSPPKKVKSTVSRPTKSAPKPKPDVPPKPTKAAPAKPTPKRAIPDVEDFDLRPAKRSKPAPAPPPVVEQRARLELPGSSFSYSQPLPAPPSLALPTSAAPPPPAQDVASDSEEDWDEVSAQIPPPADDGGEEIDMDMFSMMLERQLDQSLSGAVGQEPEDDEYDEEDVDGPDFLFSEMTDGEPPSGAPISLNQYAGGDMASHDEDDYTSSDDSDED